MPQIVIGHRSFHYSLTRKSIRSLRLRLVSADSFSVSAPILTPQFVVNHFIREHSNWILKHSSRLSSPAALPSELNILDNHYQLIISQSSRDSVVVFEDEQKIYVNSHLLTNLHLKKLLDQKLRVLALKLIKSQLSKYHFTYSRVTVRSQSSRFGSCSSTGNLSFNWQIILFPFRVFNHILLHELTHLAIKDHSLKFWRQLAIYDPHCGAHRLWLKKESSKFMIFS